MTSISALRSKEWKTDQYSNVKLGRTFGIKWLVSSKIPFSQTHELTNKWNNNEPIQVSRDTQEIPYETGLQLALKFHQSNLCPPTPPYARHSYQTQYAYNSHYPQYTQPVPSQFAPQQYPNPQIPLTAHFPQTHFYKLSTPKLS